MYKLRPFLIIVINLMKCIIEDVYNALAVF